MTVTLSTHDELTETPYVRKFITTYGISFFKKILCAFRNLAVVRRHPHRHGDSILHNPVARNRHLVRGIVHRGRQRITGPKVRCGTFPAMFITVLAGQKLIWCQRDRVRFI